MRNKEESKISPLTHRSSAEGDKSRRFPLVWLTALTLAWGGSGLFSKAFAKPVDSIALVVNQDAMTKGELEESIQSFFLAQRLKPAEPGTPDYLKAKKEVIDGFIREVLLAGEADQEKIEITDGEIDHSVDQEIDNMKKGFATEQEFQDGLKKENITVDDLKLEIRDKLLRRIKANRVLRQKEQELPGAAGVTSEDLKKYYDAHVDDYAQVKFAIILFRIPANKKSNPAYLTEVETQAKKALAELKGGADFASYAKKYSEDQGTADKGGDVGTVYRSDLDPKLAKGIFAIPDKGLGMVKTAEGVYLVKVDYKTDADYASVEPQIKEHLQKDRQTSALEQWVNGLKKNAYIVEDGVVVSASSVDTSDAGADNTAAPSASVSSTAAAPTNEPSPSADKTTPASAAQTVTSAQPVKSENYPTLPDPGTFTFYFGVESFNYGSKDLSDYYASSANANQNFPFGYGLNLGLDWALDPTLQFGVLVQSTRKFTEDVQDTSLNNWQWTAGTVGALVSAKVLIPLDENTNFILSGAGGYYLLLGSSVTVTGPTANENANLTAGNWGGQAGVGLEFFMDSHRNTSITADAGYRLLQFNPITTNVTASANGPALPSPLLDPNGKPTVVDFSGVRAGVSVRFYLGKGSD